VKLKDSGFVFESRSNKGQQAGEQVGLRFELSKKGSLVYDGKMHTFNYPMAREGMFRWDHYFQFYPESEVPTLWRVNRSKTTEGLFDIANGSSGNLLLTNHAGLTTLRVRRLTDKVSNYGLKKLVVTINFEYSSQKN
jgi:hypothetical protein